MMSSDKYINAAIENIEKKLKSEGRHLLRRADTPMSSGYGPEEDVSVELEGTNHTYFQELIGILQWAIDHAKKWASRTGHTHICFFEGKSKENACTGSATTYIQ